MYHQNTLQPSLKEELLLDKITEEKPVVKSEQLGPTLGKEIVIETKLAGNIISTLQIPKNLAVNSAIKIGDTEIDFDFETPQTTYRENDEIDPLQ